MCCGASVQLPGGHICRMDPRIDSRATYAGRRGGGGVISAGCPTARGFVAPFVAAALALGLSACGDSAGPERGTSLEELQSGGAPAAAGGADEGDVAQAPDDDTERFLPDQASHLGQRVTVSGRIVEILEPHAFVIGEGDLATLVTRPEAGLVPQPGTVAQVTGVVGRFAVVDVEERMGADFELPLP